MSDRPSSAESVDPAPSRRGLIHRLSTVPTPAIFVASIVIALLLLWREGSLADVGRGLRHADLLTFISGLLLYLVGLALLCVRWDLIVRIAKGTSRLARSAEAFLTSVAVNYATPIGLAVPMRAGLTKRALGLDTAQTGAVALWEVAVDILVLSVFSVLWIALGGWRADFVDQASSGEIFAGAAVAAIGIAAVVAAGITLARLRPLLWAGTLTTARTIVTFPAKRPIKAAIVVAMTVVYWVEQGAVMWLLLRALDVTPSALLVLGLMSVPILVGMLSPVPGGAGVREVLMIAVANVHDVDSALIILAAVTYRIALFASIPILYAGVRFWISRHPNEPISDSEQMAAT